jgi:hypothetical protein
MKKIAKCTCLVVLAASLLIGLVSCGSVPSGDPKSVVQYDKEWRFDYTAKIAAANFKSSAFTAPEAAGVPLKVESARGITGAVLTKSSDAANTKDLYLNAYAAGDKLTISGTGIASAVNVYKGAETPVAVANDKFSFTPKSLATEDTQDEVVRVTMKGGEIYNIHTVHEKLPLFKINADNNPDKGVYTFSIEGFFIRLSTDGTIAYYRFMGHMGRNSIANFEPKDIAAGRYYTYFCETDASLRDPAQGYNSGMFVVMDSNYAEVNYVTLYPTDHHGEGYLDQHEFLLFSPTHWLSMSYSIEHVNNIPSASGDSTEAYVQAGIIQEVKDGKVLMEIDSVDYPELYALAMTSNDYAKSSPDVPASICDYVHPNSLDIDNRDNNIIVSLRSLSSILKFDRATGEIIWILGGRGNEFSGLDSLTNAEGVLFLYQHNAQYVDSSVTGNSSTISLYDNETNFTKNTTRALMLNLDEVNKTGKVVNLINCKDYDEKTGVYHWATHCGNVEYQTAKSAVIGWGLHVGLDLNADTIGTKAVLTEINPQNGDLLYEITPMRNPSNAASKMSFMSYRAYKTAG